MSAPQHDEPTAATADQNSPSGSEVLAEALRRAQTRLHDQRQPSASASHTAHPGHCTCT